MHLFYKIYIFANMEVLFLLCICSLHTCYVDQNVGQNMLFLL